MRPTRQQWAMTLAVETAKRGTCLRRQVGCVLLNQRGHVLSTGYNGVSSGIPHCNEILYQPVYHDDDEVVTHHDLGKYEFRGVLYEMRQMNGGEKMVVGHRAIYPNACLGFSSPSGTNLDSCHAIHAEQNALLQCHDVYQIHSCFTTTSPCITCVKLLLNTSCQEIYFMDEYSQSSARELWEKTGRRWIRMLELNHEKI